MNAPYEPSPDFVSRVMREVRRCDRGRIRGTVLRVSHLLAAGGALLGVLRAMPVF